MERWILGVILFKIALILIISLIYFPSSDFPDYDGEELNQISGLLARDYGYNYPPEARYVKHAAQHHRPLFLCYALIPLTLLQHTYKSIAVKLKLAMHTCTTIRYLLLSVADVRF